MTVYQVEFDEESEMFIRLVDSTGSSAGVVLFVHDAELCEGHGCAMHGHPTPHALWLHPLLWREEPGDIGRLERVCDHGQPHPDLDSSTYWAAKGRAELIEHVCDGCCVNDYVLNSAPASL